MVRRKQSRSSKSRKDRQQDKKISKLMSLVDTDKKQLDTFYAFRGIYQPGGNPSSPTLSNVCVSAVSLLEGVNTATSAPGGPVLQPGTSKKNRSDTRITLDNLSIQMRLFANSAGAASNTQQVYVAIIRSKNYNPYVLGVPANLNPTGNALTNAKGCVDDLLLEITKSNPTVGNGLTNFQESSTGFSTIIGNNPPTQSFGGSQFMRPMWATDSKYHYDVLYARKHNLVKDTDGSNNFGFIGFKDININLKKKVKGMKISYAQTDPLTNDASQVNENNIFLCMWSDQTAQPPSAEVNLRLKWFD